MKEILEQLEQWSANIKFDISCDWNDDKFTDVITVSKLEIAISILKTVDNDRNIS